MWSVFHLRDPFGDTDRAAEANEVEKLFEELEAGGVVIRGLYDVAGLRAVALARLESLGGKPHRHAELAVELIAWAALGRIAHAARPLDVGHPAARRDDAEPEHE